MALADLVPEESEAGLFRRFLADLEGETLVDGSIVFLREVFDMVMSLHSAPDYSSARTTQSPRNLAGASTSISDR
jgi:hypothetical protein